MLQKMKSSDTGAENLPGEEEECPVPIDFVSVPPGIVETTVETDGQSMAIDYDPQTISDESVRQVAARLMPEAQRRFDKCVMRLGGRACEACALKLERKAQRIQGVRHARATFIGGVMSVTFDNAQLSPAQVIERVRETGAAVVRAPFEGAVLLFLFSLSNVLQTYAIGRTRKAIHSLMKLRPDKALTRRDGETSLLPIEQLVVGDLVIVRPGESIALDGVIVEGESSIDESSLTGESMPVLKKAHDPVFAATINQTGGLEVRVTRLAKDSTIEKLIRMVEDAQSEKAETQCFLDRAEQFYAIGVIVFTLALIVLPLFFLHEPFHSAFYRAMTVIVVASPCALIISTPASILSAIGGAARRGVLFKGGVHLERTATIKVVAFDKTGTLTEGKPRVTDIISAGAVIQLAENVAPEALRLLRLAASVEAKSEHPLAAAIVAEAKHRGLLFFDCTDFHSISGQGASGIIDRRRVGIGNIRYFEKLGASIHGALAQQLDALQDAGKTCALVGEIGEKTIGILGGLAIADVLRAEAPGVVRARSKRWE
jgi:Cd2+/Zn2+-exporting ATPase